MFSSDYLVRQLQQFVQALAQVLLHKKSGRHDLAQSVIHNTMMDVLGKPLSDLRLLDRDSLTGLLTRQGIFDGDLALSVADLLAEDGTSDAKQRALWLYEAALASGATVPVDIGDRIDQMQEDIRP